MARVAPSPPARRPRRGGRGISPRPRQGGAGRRRRRQARRSVVSRSTRTPRSASSPTDSPEALPLYRHSTAHLLAAAVTNLFPGAQCGIGPATDEGFFYDFVVAAAVRARGSRGDREEDEGARRRRISSTSARCGRARRRRRSSPTRGEPLKVQLIDEKTEGQTRGVLLHDQGPGDLHRLLRRPARAVDRQAEGVQAADHVERVLEGRRAQPADAARLRHRVLLATRI